MTYQNVTKCAIGNRGDEVRVCRRGHLRSNRDVQRAVKAECECHMNRGSVFAFASSRYLHCKAYFNIDFGQVMFVSICAFNLIWMCFLDIFELLF